MISKLNTNFHTSKKSMGVWEYGSLGLNFRSTVIGQLSSVNG